MLSPRVEAAVLAAAQAGVPTVLATGKARGPWAADVLSRLQLQTPGVFLQVRVRACHESVRCASSLPACSQP